VVGEVVGETVGKVVGLVVGEVVGLRVGEVVGLVVGAAVPEPVKEEWALNRLQLESLACTMTLQQMSSSEAGNGKGDIDPNPRLRPANDRQTAFNSQFFLPSHP
jgi:hypothetical protein